METHTRMLELLDRACIAALASGIPHSELWIEHSTGCVIDTRLMRGAGGPPEVGEVSHGIQIARVWLVPIQIGKLHDWAAAGAALELRYEGIDITDTVVP